MRFSSELVALTACALLATFVVAHPGDDHTAELAQRSAYMKTAAKRSLDHYASNLESRRVQQRSHLRRRQLAESLRQRRDIASTSYLRVRDLDSVLANNHHSNLTGISLDSSDDVIFSSNSSCILNPETTQGPYYVSGEYIRQNVTESQEGVPLTVDVQFIDINTCLPVPHVMLDFWHCNSTGVYSGINSQGNGNTADTSNLNKTFLRGIQSSDSEGVVTMHSIFPGHYTGRTTHIHVLSHLNATVGTNGTLSTTGQITHVGQMFFDQDLITQVEAQSPYTNNIQDLTKNADDMILSQSAKDVDPLMEYVLLGDSIRDGLLAWTTVGINVSSSYDVSAAATFHSTGGVENTSSGMEMGGGGGPGNGTAFGGNGTTSSNTTTSGNGTESATTNSAPSFRIGFAVNSPAFVSFCLVGVALAFLI